MEKKITEGVEENISEEVAGMQKKVTDGMNEYLEKIMAELTKQNKELRLDFKETKDAVLEVKTEIKDMKKELDEVKEDLKKDIGSVKTQLTAMGQRVIGAERYVEDLDIKVVRLAIAQEQADTISQYRATENHLRFRGIDEEDNENITRKMVLIIAEFLEISPEAVEAKVDVVYRVKSAYAEKKNLPRDVIVQFIAKRLKEQILAKHFQEPLKVLNKKVIIMKELPKKMVQDRKKYKKLADILRQKEIRFRWDIPQGLSFTYRGSRRIIHTVGDMEQFLADYQEDLKSLE